MSREVVPANAGGVLMDRMLNYVARQFPGEREKRGDKRLEEARNLIIENRLGIHADDLQVVEERIAYARDVKVALDSKSGAAKLLHAREYLRSAESAIHAARVVLQDTSSELEMSQCDRVTGVALSLSRVYLCCKDAFPTAQMKAQWEEDVWREACAKTGSNPESLIPIEIFTEGNIKLFTQTKKRVMHIVEAQYNFDTSNAPESTSRNATLSQALLTDMAFIYPERNPVETYHHPYRHPSLQKVINVTWFRYKDDDGVNFHEYFSPLSVPAIAFILTVIECCIDEWMVGTRQETEWDEQRFKAVYQSHISSLDNFWGYVRDQGADLFEHIRSSLLKEARRHAGVPLFLSPNQEGSPKTRWKLLHLEWTWPLAQVTGPRFPRFQKSTSPRTTRRDDNASP